MSASAVIFGCSGLTLTAEERRFFAEVRPCGFILFARNVESPEQVKALVAELKACVSGPVAILIDQEGGRVRRLKEPHWPFMPPAASLRGKGRAEARRYGEETGAVLAALGINVNCAPVCDLDVLGADPIIGNRSFGASPEEVVPLAEAYAEGLTAAGVSPVLKHIPGHGRALCDSHEALPVVDAPLELLEREDFAVFKALRRFPCAMTAHIVYSCLDAARPATLSPACIAYIREEIGFQGAVMSDDICMKALQGTLAARVRALYKAGCDIALHCSGKTEEMREIAPALRLVNGRTDAWLETLAG
jgi:beta-N-acetylhexosaminidase